MRIEPMWVVLAIAVAAFFWMRRASGPRVDGPRARQLVGEGALLLDVRTPGEFAGAHLPGAVNIPVQQLGQRLGELPVERPIVVYCASGMRSAAAARQLRAAGRTHVWNLGAISAW